MSDANGVEGGGGLSRAASARLVVGLVVFMIAGVVTIVGLRPVAHWTVAGMTERMGLEGLGVDPEEGQVIPGGLVGATEKSSVDLVLGTRLHLALDANTRVTLGRAPGRWFRRTAEVRLEKGTLRVVAGGSGGSVPLRVSAPGAVARADHAAFSAAATDGETCFSVGEGAIRVAAAGPDAGATGGGAATSSISAGERGCYDASGRAGSTGVIDPAERDSLARLAAERLVPAAPPAK